MDRVLFKLDGSFLSVPLTNLPSATYQPIPYSDSKHMLAEVCLYMVLTYNRARRIFSRTYGVCLV